MKIIQIILGFLLLVSSCAVSSKSKVPELFVFLGGSKASDYGNLIQNKCINGVQIIYSWKQLEPAKNEYNFSKIEKDLVYLNKLNKKLFIQIQDRSFAPEIFNVPDYIRTDPVYHGGVEMQYDFPGEGQPITTGWVARTWDPAVKERFHVLIQQLSARFDGKVYGINLPETSADFDQAKPPADFTSDKYFASVVNNLGFLKEAFKKSIVIQYVNFFPGEWDNDKLYMSRIFAFALKHRIGLGGPDVVPFKESQMKNSYPFFHKVRGELLTAIAIQEPDYTYKNPKTGDYYSFKDFYTFARAYLGASILFWNIEEPFFSTQLLPHLNRDHFVCGNIVIEPADK